MVAERFSADQAERHDEMADYMQRVGAQSAELLVDERNLPSVAHENVSGNEQLATCATEHVVQVETELRGIRDGIFAPTDTNLNPSANTGEPKVFYCKVKGDYYRYTPEPQPMKKIMEDCDELIPEWLNFIKGFEDSEELPLNIYRGTLLEDKILRVIKKNYVTKYLEILAKIAELNAAYKRFYEQFGARLKLGISEDSTVGVKTAEVLRFNTSKAGDEQDDFEGYVGPHEGRAERHSVHHR